MADILCVRIDWNHTAVPLRIAQRFFTLSVVPEPEYPFGRKGLGLVRTWQMLGGDLAGMLLLDGDVAIDPVDFDAMLRAIDREPDAVHTAPVRLWPVSTHHGTWVWGHGRDGRYTQQDYSSRLDVFTFCFTYLPRALVEHCIGAGMSTWSYPHVDRNAVKAARELKLPVRLVRGARPCHLNY